MPGPYFREAEDRSELCIQGRQILLNYYLKALDPSWPNNLLALKY